MLRNFHITNTWGSNHAENRKNIFSTQSFIKLLDSLLKVVTYKSVYCNNQGEILDLHPFAWRPSSKSREPKEGTSYWCFSSAKFFTPFCSATSDSHSQQKDSALDGKGSGLCQQLLRCSVQGEWWPRVSTLCTDMKDVPGEVPTHREWGSSQGIPVAWMMCAIVATGFAFGYRFAINHPFLSM